MGKSACKPKGRRGGFTLIEMMLAGVLGSMLLATAAYSSMEMTKAVEGVYHETFLQTVARDVQLNLDSSLNAANKDGVPDQIQVSDAGMTMGKASMRWKAGDPNAVDTGGSLEYTLDNGATWTSMASLGSRGDFAHAEFAYGKFTTADDTDIPVPGQNNYVLDDRVRNNLMRVTTLLGKKGMVPLYLQQVRAPRALSWSWVATSSGGNPALDSDHDGIMDDKDDFPLDPQRAYTERYPSAQGNLASVAFEDLYPSLGDADYNDCVSSFYMKETYGPGTKDAANTALRPALKGIYMRFYAQARGAGHHHALRLNLAQLMRGDGDVLIQRYDADGVLKDTVNTTASASPVIDIFPDTAVQLPPGSDGWSTNTVPNTSFVPGWSAVVSLTFADPSQNRYNTTMDPPYDTFLHDFNTNNDIHLPMCNVAGGTTGVIDSYQDPTTRAIAKVVDPSGNPWALLVPGNWAWPLEGQDIHQAYPKFSSWVASGHPQGSDWFAYPVANRYKTASLNPGNAAAPAPIAQTSFNDPDANGNARYAYIFEPKYFTGGLGSFVAPTTTSTSVPTLAPTATPVVAGNGLYPIALSQDALLGHAVGDVIPDILCGAGRGNFGWLSWAGSTDAPTLARSLTAPGDAYTYANPSYPTDHVINAGDNIAGSTGTKNSSDVRGALDALLRSDIVVPVYDTAAGSGANAQYHCVGFAKVSINSYALPGTASINATFRGWVDSSGNVAAAPATPTPAPTATPYVASTPASNTLFPIALGADLIRGKNPGANLGEVRAGYNTDNFLWVSWNGDQSDSIWRGSMALPGNSNYYTNPSNAADHHVDVGDLLTAFRDVSNIPSNRSALDAIHGRDLVVPVFGGYTRSNETVTVSQFAKVRATSQELEFSRDRLNAVYMGPCDSAGGALATGAPATPAPTPTPTPTPTPVPTPTPHGHGHH